MTREERIALLRMAGFELPSNGTSTLANHFRSKQVAPSEYLFHEGDTSGSLFVVESGMLEAVTTSQRGQELVFSSMGPGSVIGELTIIDGDRRTAGVRAATDSRVLSISRQVFLREARLDPEIGFALARLCADRVKALSQWVSDSSFQTLSSRLATAVLTMAGERHADNEVRVTQQALADRLGVSRESVNKWLRRWEGDGTVELARGSISIIDRRPLEAIAVS